MLKFNLLARKSVIAVRTLKVPPPALTFTPKYNKLFINNQFVDSCNGRTFETINPGNNKVITSVSEGDHIDIDIAVNSARKAFELGSEWRRMDASYRGILLNKLADLVERDRIILATLESLDNGKPYPIAYIADLGLSIKCLRYYAGWADKNHGKTIPIDGDYFSYTRHEPIGVCGQISAWNFPLLLLTWKFGPALAMGNTMVFKAAEQTPLSALHFAALTKEAGFPDGVINIITGYGPTAGSALAKHPNVDKIAFTGSTQIGKIIMNDAANSNLKKVTLELGGKSPNIIFDDVNVDEAVKQAVHGVMFNMGQCCCAGTRTFVQASIYDEFIEKAKNTVEKLKIGSAFEEGVEHGPQIDKKQVETILKYIELGKTEGARLVTGGSSLNREGCFVEPTIFADVTNDMTIAQEEIFGPVFSIFKFEDENDLVTKANDTIYGLAAGVMTNNVNRALHVANNIRAGTVWVNCYDVFDAAAPFGGYKMSGIGRELGEYGLQAYSEVKTVTIKVPQKNS
ncbi:Retinal dehydrogenase 2 [Strongyloides ratti]|uniref:Retinal dehydrogenase 2 n=1 Tax=Strongyloides ratti TaxID=34506 RepID=A0A090KWC3_STRRB|nr:Retinal dehydrogenase 2 [Strongyloides ratti]CEF61795.1 Retinal dehydrogenase 2 [Strongyloides ratti]